MFEQCFQRWVQSLIDTLGLQVVALDNKTLKGSYDRETCCQALHVVSAWASEQRLVLGQLKVRDKSNEITAIPALLKLLDLCGCIVTIDAMGTQTAIATAIRQGQSNYILTSCAWSYWRRRHKAIAKFYHYKRRLNQLLSYLQL